MSDTEMIERAARAIAALYGDECSAMFETCEVGGTEGGTCACRDAARAAIAAMREPTPAMIEACNSALNRYIDALPNEVRAKSKEPGGYIFVKGTDKPAIRWRAMIDAALTPEIQN